MSEVYYDVPLVTQGANPICWICCMAMVASQQKGYSMGTSKFENGFDPNNSCTSNTSISADDTVIRLKRAKFTSGEISATPNGIAGLLASGGPFILTHLCKGFPYGAGWPPMTSGVHAVVITGINTEGANGGWCWMNNPWGDLDRAITTAAVVTALKLAKAGGYKKPVAYYDP